MDSLCSRGDITVDSADMCSILVSLYAYFHTFYAYFRIVNMLVVPCYTTGYIFSYSKNGFPLKMGNPSKYF